MKRTVAAYAILLGLTALMIALYLDQSKMIGQMLQNYAAVLP